MCPADNYPPSNPPPSNCQAGTCPGSSKLMGCLQLGNGSLSKGNLPNFGLQFRAGAQFTERLRGAVIGFAGNVAGLNNKTPVHKIPDLKPMLTDLQRPTKSGMEQFLRKIHQVSIDSGHDLRLEIENLLKLGATEFGFDISVITCKTSNQMIVHYSTDKETMPLGLEVEYGTSFCSEVVASESPLMIENVMKSEYVDHPAHTGLGIKSYLGHPICFNDNQKASVCFLNLDSKEMNLGSEIPEHLVLLSQRLEALIEHLQISEDLKRSEEMFRTTFENANLGIAHVSPEGKLQKVNQCLADFLGYEIDELQQKHFQDITHSDDREISSEYIDSEPVSARVDSLEKRYLRKDGSSVWGRVKATRIIDKHEYSIVLIEDIEKEKQAEQERLAFEAGVQEAQKLESLGVLAGGIAHDFNNLLTSIMGNANLLQNALSSQSPLQKQAANIEKAALHAADLTSQLLAYAGKGNFIVQAIDVPALVDDMQNLLATATSKRVKLCWEKPEAEFTINADATQIRQVIMNLITNASESCGDEAGDVKIEVYSKRVDGGEPLSSHWAVIPEPGHYVAIRISDNGCGMDEETRRRLFEPFYTRKFLGRGLGLSAVLGIIRSHNGGVMVESELGKGTTVEVLFGDCNLAYLPGKEDDEVSAENRKTVLVVDDELQVREVTAEIVSCLGYRVVTAESGDAALEKLASIGELEFVLLDVSMPGITVQETLQGIREYFADLPVILMSGFNEQHVSEVLAAYRNIYFLKKPFTISRLEEQIAQHVSNGTDHGFQSFKSI